MAGRIWERTTVAVIGLGYVGLPLAQKLAQHLKVVAFALLSSGTRTAPSPSVSR